LYLSEGQNGKVAKRFLAAALKRSRDWVPRVINTDKNSAYGGAITVLKGSSVSGLRASEVGPSLSA
jgi:transposase-like protein